MVITASSLPGRGRRNSSTTVEQVQIDGQTFLRYTHRDGRMEYRPLTDDEAKHLEGLANIRQALEQYEGPIAP